MQLPSIPALFFQAAAREQARDPGAEMVQAYEGDRRRSIPWSEALEVVESSSAALIARGIEPGESVGILAETSPQWSSADTAILAVGGVTVGIYPTCRPEEIGFVLRDAEARLAFVDTWDHVELLDGLRATIPRLEAIVVLRPRGPLPADASPSGLRVLSGEALLAEGRSLGEEGRARVHARADAVTPDDLATLVYTSGTTGPPKGVELTHGNLLHTAEISNRLFPLGPGDVSLVYLPLAHVLQRVTLYVGLMSGSRGVYLERIEDLKRGFEEVQPTVLAAVPRIYEKVHARIVGRVAAERPRRQKIFWWAIDVGRRYQSMGARGEPIPTGLRLEHVAADRLVLRKIRGAFGGRIRYMISGAAPISAELLEFFRAAGLLILEGYGLTETAAPVTVNTLGAYRFGTVGQPVPGCAVRIAGDGEVLATGPNVCRGYRGRPDANEESFSVDDEGVRWLHTGDIGSLDAEGYLCITDRKKNIVITAAGKNVAPQPIENALREHPLVEFACVIGDRRRYLTALLTLDEEEAEDWARRSGMRLSGTGRAALAASPEVQASIAEHVDKVNATLARFESIKRHAVLPDAFTIEGGAITPSLKLKRRVIEERWAEAISALYPDPA